MKQKKRLLTHAIAAAALAVAVSAPVAAQDTIKIGLLATLEGPFAAGGEDGMRGARLAVAQRGGMVAGKQIEIITASSDANPEVAVGAARRLVEQDGVDILVGPLSGSEGIAVKDYSMTQPGVTFINGASGAQATTLIDPSPNFFRFNTEGAQWMVGLGREALARGYERVMIIAEDYAFPYSQVQGFMTEFCALGGRVPMKAWVPLGGRDYSSVIARIPPDIDALVVILGGADAVNFLNQYEQAGEVVPLIGGSITVSQDVLNYRGRARASLVGTLAAGPLADAYDAPEWIEFVEAYREAYPDGYPSPSLFALVYYINMSAALQGLEMVDGDLSDDHAALREALSTMTLQTPVGETRLDENRQAIGTTFITEVRQDDQGGFYNAVVSVNEGVDQYLGLSEEEFWAVGLGSRDVPDCP